MPGVDLTLASYTILAVGSLFLFKYCFQKHELDHIPTVGYSSPLLSYLSAIKFIWSGPNMVKLGYDKYPGRAFKIPTVKEWVIVVNGPKLVDDIRKASEDQLSFTLSLALFYQFDYTLGPHISRNPYHVGVVRTGLTRNIDARFADIREEIVLAFDDAIPSGGPNGEWMRIPVFDATIDIISQVSARVFVGLPLSRNADYRNLCVQITMEIVKGRVLGYFPTFLRPLAGKLLTRMDAIIQRKMEYLGPLIEHRLEQEQIHGKDWPGKPNDLLTWLLDEAEGEERSVRNITIRMLLISFASIHSSAMAFTHALYELAARPEYIKPLREEVELVVQQEGWTKTSIGNMYKVDSFLRESQRLHGLSVLLAGRRVLKDFTLSDGTFVPAGSNLCGNAWGTQHDDANYPNADAFDGFRFVKEDGETQQLMVTPTLKYLAFGHGRPACPGRFLAVTELKAMLAHVVTTYDLRMENDGVRPPDQCIETNIIPNRKAKAMFRKRI